MPFAQVAAGQQADVVAEVAVEHAHAALVRAVVETQGQVAGDRLLLRKPRVAHLVGAGGDVSAIGIQLVEGRCTFGVAQAGGQRPHRGQLVHRTRGQAGGGEAAGAVGLGETFAALAVGVDPGVLQACAQAQVEAVGGLPLFEHEQRQAVGIGLRHEGFFAQRRELVAGDLGADHAFHRPQRLVPSLDAGLVALVLEGGMHLAAFQLLMLVVGVAGVELERAERAVEVAQFGGKGVVVLFHGQTHAGLGHRTVVGIVAAVGQARVTVFPVVRTADGTTVLAPVAVFQAMLAAGFVGIAHLRTAGVAGDAQIVELAAVGVQVQGEAAIAGFQLARTAAGGVGAPVAQLAGTMNALHRRVGDAVVEGVDHPADGIATVEQGGRAAHDLDALDVHRVQWHGVVVRQRRGIQCTHAVAQDTDPVAVQAADHRAAGARAEPGGGDAGLGVQGFAQAALLLQGQCVAFEHAAGGCQRGAQRVGGDDLRLQFNRVAGQRGQPQCGGKGGEVERQVTHGGVLGSYRFGYNITLP